MNRFARRPAASTDHPSPLTAAATPRRWTAVPLVLGCLLLLLPLLAGCGADPGPEVWVIGLDGGDWDMLDPLIANGDMPNLAALRAGGAAGVLRSEKPLISPVLWTTIATGKSPDLHGVTWFMTDNADGTKTPISSTQRRVRSFWNVASEAGLRSGVIGWWATWPADPVDGFVISDYVGWHSFGVSGRGSDDAGKTWPPDLMERVNELLPDPAAIPASRLTALVDLPLTDLAAKDGADAYGDPISHLRQALATSRGYTDLALDRLAHDRPSLLAVYYEGTDAIMHLFGDYEAPRQPWVDEADFKAYHRVVSAYWKWQDQLLGELLARRGPATTVIVVSDHGFRVGDERRKEDAFHIETADADHMLDGIVVVNGPGVWPGTRLTDADIYDVAPTVLYALGLPVAADLAGRVLTDAMDPAWLASAPIRSVVTYETSPLVRADAVAGGADATANLEKMLRSLGYIAGSGETPTHTAPEEVVNMATVLMHQGRFGEAIAALRTAAAADPGIMEIRLNLAQALARAGEPEQLRESEQIYRELLRSHPDRPEVREDLTTLLMNTGRDREALPVFADGLAQDPRWVNGLVGRGRAHLRLGQLAAAEADLRQALQENPRHARAQATCGLVLLQSGRTAEGVGHLAEAHRLEPAEAEVALKLAAALQKDRRNEEALQVLQRCLDNGGPEAAVLAEKGAVLLRLGRTDAAVEPLQQSVALDGSNVLALGNLGMAFAMGGELPSAVATFEKVVGLAPDLADGHAQLGALYAQTGQLERAEQEMQTAVRQDPDNPGLLVNLGRVHTLQGERAEARKVLEEALEIDPSFVPALYQLGELEQKAGHPQEAARLREKARSYEKVGRSRP